MEPLSDRYTTLYYLAQAEVKDEQVTGIPEHIYKRINELRNPGESLAQAIEHVRDQSLGDLPEDQRSRIQRVWNDKTQASKELLEVALQKWVSEGGPEEKRAEAADRIRRYDSSKGELDLSRLNLKSLPAVLGLPPFSTTLKPGWLLISFLDAFLADEI